MTPNTEIWHESLVAACPPCMKRLQSGSICLKVHPQALHTDTIDIEELAELDTYKHIEMGPRQQELGKKDKVYSGRVEKAQIASQFDGRKLKTSFATKQRSANISDEQRICDICHCKHTGPCKACLKCMTWHQNGICPQRLRLASDSTPKLRTELERQAFLFETITKIKTQEELDIIVANLLNHPDQIPSLDHARTTTSSPPPTELNSRSTRPSSPSPELILTKREARENFFAKTIPKLSRSKIGLDTITDLMNDPSFMPVTNDFDNDLNHEDSIPSTNSKKRRKANKRGGRRSKPAKGKGK